jgi:hypothetical protein
MRRLKMRYSLLFRGPGSMERNKYWDENARNEIKQRTAGIANAFREGNSIPAIA